MWNKKIRLCQMRWSSKRASLFEFQNCEFSKYTSQKFDVRNFKNTTGLIWDAIFKDVVFTPFKLQLAWLEINIRSLMELRFPCNHLSLQMGSQNHPRNAELRVHHEAREGWGVNWGDPCWLLLNLHLFAGKDSAPVAGQKELHGILPPSMKTDTKLCLHRLSPWNSLGSI